MSTLAGHAFVKMNGLGNEIVVVDMRATPAPIAAEDARAAAAAGAAQAPADPDVLYDRAVVLAVIEDPQAVAALGTAIAAGYPADDVLRDDEWDRLRTDDGFRRATAAR